MQKIIKIRAPEKPENGWFGHASGSTQVAQGAPLLRE